MGDRGPANVKLRTLLFTNTYDFVHHSTGYFRPEATMIFVDIMFAMATCV